MIDLEKILTKLKNEGIKSIKYKMVRNLLKKK